MVPPSPSPASAKVSSKGASKLEQNPFLMIFYDFFEKGQKHIPFVRFCLVSKWGPYGNYSSRFPEEVQKEEIQQRRQARSLPGEKETLNSMLREKMVASKIKNSKSKKISRVPLTKKQGISWYAFRLYSLKIMLRVSFCPGRDHACRHCWISSFRTPSGKRLL